MHLVATIIEIAAGSVAALLLAGALAALYFRWFSREEEMSSSEWLPFLFLMAAGLVLNVVAMLIYQAWSLVLHPWRRIAGGNS
jgi:hypothetical protein